VDDNGNDEDADSVDTAAAAESLWREISSSVDWALSSSYAKDLLHISVIIVV